MNRITHRKSDDWHLHVRDGAMLKDAEAYRSRMRVAGPDERALVYRGGETIEWRVTQA